LISDKNKYKHNKTSINTKKNKQARIHINRARELEGANLSALIAESYSRSYNNIVRVQGK